MINQSIPFLFFFFSPAPDSVFQSLLLACTTQNAKLVVPALQTMQKILSVTPVLPRCLIKCLVTWRQLADLENETVRLKILQTLLLVVSPENVCLLGE